MLSPISPGSEINDAGDIHLSQTFYESIDIDLGPQGVRLISQGDYDFALVRFSQGVSIDEVNLEAAFSIASSGSDTAYDIAHDAAGNMFNTGIVLPGT